MHLLFSITCFLVCSAQYAKGWNDTHYRAAVMTYFPQTFCSMSTLDFIRPIVKSKQMGADIVVFSENLIQLDNYCVNSYWTSIPSPEEKIAPYLKPNQYNSFLVKTSQQAMESSIYVVVNLFERVVCPTCPASSSVLYYNTNVALDRSGVVVARYRIYNAYKPHYLEYYNTNYSYNRPANQEVSSFDTDFGVKFGILSTADLLHEHSLKLLQNSGIKNVVYTSYWKDEMPFLMSLGVQQSWASVFDVNLLASGYGGWGKVDFDSFGGSGIYRGNQGPIGIYQYHELDNHETKVFAADVPKTTGSFITESMNTGTKSIKYLEEDLTLYQTELLKNIKAQQQICHNEFCCKFDVDFKTTATAGLIYRAAVFNGIRNFGNTTIGVQICAVVTCLSETELTQCGSGPKLTGSDMVSAKFNKLQITGQYWSNSTLQMPVAHEFLLSGAGNLQSKTYKPLEASNYDFKKNCNAMKCDVTLGLTGTLSDLNFLTAFGIYGRDFSRDGQKVTATDSGSLQKVSFIALIIVAIHFIIQ